MKKVILVFGIFTILLCTSSSLQAATYVFDVTQDTLAHEYSYTWGIDWSPNAHETIQSAQLSFENFYNGGTSATKVYVHLLDSADPGVTAFDDPVPGWVDFFQGEGGFLFDFEIPVNEIRNAAYTFNATDIDLLSAFSQDGNFGIGFDPDCAPVGSIRLSIETTHAPVPASLLLLGSGLVGLVTLKRRYRDR